MSARTASMSSGSRKPGCRARQSGQVAFERERHPLIESNDLEHSVAAHETLVADRDSRLRKRAEDAIDARQRCRRIRRGRDLRRRAGMTSWAAHRARVVPRRVRREQCRRQSAARERAHREPAGMTTPRRIRR